MSEQQTTAVWIESVLETELHLIPLMVGVNADSADIGGMDAAARTIAVRIDRLTWERDEARASLTESRANALDGMANLERSRNELRAEVERLNTLRAKETAEARAELLQKKQQLAEARAERGEYGNTIDRMTVNEIRLKAEVERIEPYAEAWEAFMRCRETRLAYKHAPCYGLLDRTFETWYSARSAFRAAYKTAARAREAAKGTP